jgi:hypothetical protein
VSSEVRTTSVTGGQKGVKLARYDLIPVDALRQLAEHYGKGAEKYDDNQWRKGYEWSKSYAALMRHLTQWWNGEDVDDETGSNHLAAVAWHAFALLTFTKDYPQYDDRFKREVGNPNRELEDLLKRLPEWAEPNRTAPVNPEFWRIGDFPPYGPTVWCVTSEGSITPEAERSRTWLT